MEEKNERAWYILQTFNGVEHAVKRNIMSRVESFNMGDKIFDVLIPEKTVVEKKKNGDIKEKKVVIHPGYVFIDMIVTDDTWFMVRNTPMVTGFLGSSGGGAKPVSVPEHEMAAVFKECGITGEQKYHFEIGEVVSILSGPFGGQTGKVAEVDYEKGILKVEVDFFGRSTPTELEFVEVKQNK